MEIFPNRIEIENPGRFPGLTDPTQPLAISRYARNPRIVRVCSDLLLGISRPTASRHLQALRTLELVEWDGQGPRDPRPLVDAALNY